MSKMRLLRAAACGAGLILPAAALAAGGHHHADPIGGPGKPEDASRTIQIEMFDNYYEPLSIEIAAGETVRFVVHNAGALLHEFNIGTPHMHEEHQAQMAEMMRHGMITKTRIVPEMMKMDHAKAGMPDMRHNHANSVLVEPGSTAELVWRFDQPVKIEFACNMPGHYEVGMAGAIHFRQ